MEGDAAGARRPMRGSPRRGKRGEGGSAVEPLRIDKRALVRIKPSPRHFILLDTERCDGCGACAVICPMDLWKVREGRARLARDYRRWCLECGSCYLACGRGAVGFDYPPPGTGVTYEKS